MSRGRSREVYEYIVCDHPDCCTRQERVTVGELVDQGWYFPARTGTQTGLTGTDWCRAHRVYAMPGCDFCGRPMRPQKTLNKDWPGTVARGTKGNCITCTEHRHTYEGDLDRAIAYYWRLNHG